ncbi:hypothetical protein QJS10_CPA09g00554 [Acorus calamus]|uniref:Uncharacterized protein n=1 Tax=Acorus calamus TaxID=4465 RepID=A0AAV9E6W0_ACOCL|nr:hypothetical protein QJS10_CPA09g00554 [Acorus calamus]
MGVMVNFPVKLRAGAMKSWTMNVVVRCEVTVNTLAVGTSVVKQECHAKVTIQKATPTVAIKPPLAVKANPGGNVTLPSTKSKVLLRGESSRMAPTFGVSCYSILDPRGYSNSAGFFIDLSEDPVLPNTSTRLKPSGMADKKIVTPKSKVAKAASECLELRKYPHPRTRDEQSNERVLVTSVYASNSNVESERKSSSQGKVAKRKGVFVEVDDESTVCMKQNGDRAEHHECHKVDETSTDLKINNFDPGNYDRLASSSTSICYPIDDLLMSICDPVTNLPLSATADVHPRPPDTTPDHPLAGARLLLLDDPDNIHP